MIIKKTLLAAVVVLTAFTACKKTSNEYTISGTIPVEANANGKMVYLMADRNTTLDSVKVENNTFTFKGVVSDTLNFGSVYMPQDYMTSLIFEPGAIKVDLTKRVASGTALNDEYSAFSTQADSMMEVLQKNIADLQADSITPKEEISKKGEALYKEFNNKYTQMNKALYEKHHNDALGAKAFVELLQTDLTQEELEGFKKSAGDKVLNDRVVKRQLEFKANVFKTQAGAMFIDFSGVDDAGKAVKLSDYVGKGKYTLVDFWASWCGPCRREIPNIAKIYEEYKSKGLEVVGIAVWDKMEDHLSAMKELPITWPQIVNKDEATQLYGVNGIPQIMLIGPDGKIIKRNLFGEEIKAAVEEAMKDAKPMN